MKKFMCIIVCTTIGLILIFCNRSLISHDCMDFLLIWKAKNIAPVAEEVIWKYEGELTPEILTELYFTLPIRYRSTATWVISDQTAKALTDMKFTDEKPVLVNSYNGSPVGMQMTILGRPVIINEHIANLDGTGTAIYFRDLKRALIVGKREALSLQKSTEYGFINDEIAIKANMRLDIKKALGEAMVIGTVGSMAKASRSKVA